MLATARQASRRLAALARQFHSSGIAGGGGHGGYDDYVHAPNMYNITTMKNRKLKFGLGVAAVVVGGSAIPWVLDSLNFQAIKSRIDRRRLQEELDLHRLYLLTQYYAGVQAGSETDFGLEAASSLDAQAQSIGMEGCRSAVADAIQTQLSSVLTKIRNASNTTFTEQSGYTLEVRQSSAPGAGDGLWLDGNAAVGEVVALYPGVSYPPQFHRNIPGYPLVAQSNPFLISRYDGVVIDAKPWGQGAYSPCQPQAQNAAEAALLRLERRHPLALAHCANHPPPGALPNVVVAPFDWMPGRFGDEEHLRHFVPLVGFNARYAQYSKRMEEWGSIQCSASEQAQGVVFVALRDIRDEELYLNYRLNPNAPSGLPSWYHPVDAEEDARRWAQ